MIQIRYNLFETNSSSACTLAVTIAQVEGLEIPKKVYIDSNSRYWERNINGLFALAAYENQADKYLGFLKFSGVDEIYVDNELVDVDDENHAITFMKPEIILATCFGDCKVFTEWQGWGSEIEDSKFLTVKEIYKIQQKLKDPNYAVFCVDGENNDIEWTDTPYSKRHVTAEEVAKYEENMLKYNNTSYEDNYEDYKEFEELISDPKFEPDSELDKLQNKAQEQQRKNRYKR